jgi:hypothetical protein
MHKPCIAKIDATLTFHSSYWSYRSYRSDSSLPQTTQPLPPRRSWTHENGHCIKRPAGPPRCVLAASRPGVCPVCVPSQAPTDGFARPASHFLIFSKNATKTPPKLRHAQPPHQPRQEPVSLSSVASAKEDRISPPVRLTVRYSTGNSTGTTSKIPNVYGLQYGFMAPPPRCHPPLSSEALAKEDRHPPHCFLPAFRPASALK